jgi:hypothetical protein
MNFGSIILSPLLALLLYMAQQTPVPATTTTPINRILRQQRINFIPVRRREPTQNKLPNNYWGDYLGPKDNKHLRVYLQNPNRISAGDEFVDFRYMCQSLFSNDVDIFGLLK